MLLPACVGDSPHSDPCAEWREAAAQTVGRLFTHDADLSVFLEETVAVSERQQLQQELRAMPEVASVRFESKEEAFDRFKKLFAAQPELVRNASPEDLPESLRVKLRSAEDASTVVARLDGRAGVEVRSETEMLRGVVAGRGDPQSPLGAVEAAGYYVAESGELVYRPAECG